MKKIVACLALLWSASPLFAATTVIVVRHAESVQGGEDPPLTEAGTARAKALAEALKNANIAAVFVTKYARSKDTAQFVVAQTKAPVFIVEAKAYGDLAAKIRSGYANKTVLVVGHSNTVPEIVKELTGAEYPQIKHEDNSPMFIVTIDEERKSVIAAQYGQ
jgi:broad specificity phosphatase PhoE